MAQIYSSELSKEMQEAGKLQVSRDVIPNQLAEKVVPVMEVNPKLLRKVNVHKKANCFNDTSVVVYTVPSNKDFYLTSAFISFVKDITATSTYTTLTIVMEGNPTATSILECRTTTLTVERDQVGMAFTSPIKLARGSAITITNATNVANIISMAIITGYEVENIKA